MFVFVFFHCTTPVIIEWRLKCFDYVFVVSSGLSQPSKIQAAQAGDSALEQWKTNAIWSLSFVMVKLGWAHLFT